MLSAVGTICVLGITGLQAQNEIIRLDDDVTIKVDRKLYPDFKLALPHEAEPPYAAARRARKAAGIRVELPDHVNNGEDKYFPPIFNQDGGSCGSAQNIGYMFTHEIDAWRDLDASLPENQYPTHFTWLLTYNGSDKEEMAKANGIPNVATYGGRTYSKLFGAQTHEDVDFGWMQGYDKWYSAMWNRAASTFSITATATAEGRLELKEWLYDHCGDKTMPSGGVAGIGVAAYGNWKKIPTTTNNKNIGVAGMSYVDAWGDTYNHAVTVVGYDDRIEFDLDGDGKVGEKDEDEVGAWIIANSWGNGWENKGFIYCPYKYSFAVNKYDGGSWSPGSYLIRRDYRPLRTIKLKMDYDHRSELLLCAGVSANVNATQPDKVISFEHFKNAGNPKNLNPAPEVPMLGRWADGMHYEPMEFGYDLTDLTFSFDRTKPLKYFFIVKTKSNAIGSGHIYNASIMNYEIDPEGIEIPFDDKNVTIQNKGKQTIISVVVPGEQLYAPVNLTLSDGTLHWMAPQPSGLPFEGYRIYCADKLVGTVDAHTTAYTPSVLSADPYTVTAIYHAGGYIQESAPTNSVGLYIPASGDNQVVIFDESGMTVPNAITETLYQATIEFWMRSDLNRSYDQQIGPGWGNFLFHTDNSGQLYVGWNTSSGDRMIVPGIFKTGKWNHVAIVVDGNKMVAFVNGVRKGQITSSTYSGLSPFGDLKIGQSGENQFFKGGLDELRVWKKALTQAEIKASMHNAVAFPSVQEDLLVYLPMDTVEIDGEVKMRELAAGKHAKMHRTGSWKLETNADILNGDNTAHKITITPSATSFAAGMPFALKASTSVDAIDWSWHAEGAATPDAKGTAPYFLFEEAGTYIVTLTVTYTDGTTEEATQTVEVTAGSAPVAAFTTLADTLPAGDRFSFVNRTQGDGCSYVWSLPGAEVENVNTTNASALYTTLGTFDVTLTATNAYGTSTITHSVTVTAAAPAARFDVLPSSILLGDTVQLIDQSRYEPTTWTWELANGHRAFTLSGQSPSIVPIAPGIYDVTLTAANALGSGSETKGSILMVSNADAQRALHFTGSERITLGNPFTAATDAFTLDCWLRPSTLTGCATLMASDGQLSTSCDDQGALTLKIGSKSVTSANGFFIVSEWHHYAVVFQSGKVQFYRDGILFDSVSGLPTSCPAQEGTLTFGREQDGFNGLIDEFHLWFSALSQADIRRYCNAPIADIATAEALRQLAVYYDFNQNGGDVIDRSSHGFDAARINFGPDGDAWNSALGVFTLDLGAEPAGDITDRYLTNYKRPYITASGTVNPNNSGRFKKLEMGTARSAWKDMNAVRAGNIITGAHIDNDHNGDITFETVWSSFAQNLEDYRLWQTITLPAGRYTFSCTFSDGSDSQQSRIAVCYGDIMVGEDECESKAIAWNKLTEGTVSFTLDQVSEVSLGIIVNLIGQASFNISSFKLEGISIEPIETADEPTDYADGYGYLTFGEGTRALYAASDSILAWHDFDPSDPTQLWAMDAAADGVTRFTNIATGLVTCSQPDGTLSFALSHWADGQGESGLAAPDADGTQPITLTPVTVKTLTAARVQAALTNSTTALTSFYDEGCRLATVVPASAVTDGESFAHIDADLGTPVEAVILHTYASAMARRPSKVTLYASNDNSVWIPIRTFYTLPNAQPFGSDTTIDADYSTGLIALGDSYRYLRYEVNNINFDVDGLQGTMGGYHNFDLDSLTVFAPIVKPDNADLATDFYSLVADVASRHRAGIAGSYDLRRLNEATLIFASYNSVAYAALATCVAELSADGNDYRSNIYERTSADAYLEILRQAQSALAARASTDEAYAALEARLRAAYDAIAVRRDLDDGIYYIDNAWFPDFHKGLYAFDADHIAWHNADRDNPNFLWEVRYIDTTHKGCRYLIRNVGNGRYMTYSTSDYALLADSVSASRQFVGSMGDGIFTITSELSNLELTPDFTDSGNGVGGRAVGLPASGLAAGPATWTFVPATDEEVRAALALLLPTSDVLDTTYPLITDAEQLSSNYPASGRSKLSCLIEEKSSYFQTRGTLYTLDEIDTIPKPYIEVALPRLVQKFWLTDRGYSTANQAMRPMRISISASIDGDTWTDCAVLMNIGNAYPDDGGAITDKDADWCSPLIDLGAAYRFVRLTIDEVNFRSHTGNGNLYNDFSISKLQLYDADISVAIDSPVSDGTDRPIYTIDGRFVGHDASRLQPGVYVSAGRKVILR